MAHWSNSCIIFSDPSYFLTSTSFLLPYFQEWRRLEIHGDYFFNVSLYIDPCAKVKPAKFLPVIHMFSLIPHHWTPYCRVFLQVVFDNCATIKLKPWLIPHVTLDMDRVQGSTSIKVNQHNPWLYDATLVILVTGTLVLGCKISCKVSSSLFTYRIPVVKFLKIPTNNVVCETTIL